MTERNVQEWETKMENRFLARVHGSSVQQDRHPEINPHKICLWES